MSDSVLAKAAGWLNIPDKTKMAFSRFQNLAPGKKLSMDQLMEEIKITFGFNLKAEHIKRLYQVRQKAYYQQGKNRSPKSSPFVQQSLVF